MRDYRKEQDWSYSPPRIKKIIVHNHQRGGDGRRQSFSKKGRTYGRKRSGKVGGKLRSNRKSKVEQGKASPSKHYFEMLRGRVVNGRSGSKFLFRLSKGKSHSSNSQKARDVWVFVWGLGKKGGSDAMLSGQYGEVSVGGPRGSCRMEG